MDGKIKLRSLDGEEMTLNDTGVIAIDAINLIYFMKRA